MENKKDLYTHFNKLQEGLRLVDGKAFLDIETFDAQVHIGNRVLKLYPLFKLRRDGLSIFTASFIRETFRFAGWRPYFSPPKFSFSEKLTFKELMLRHKIPTPDYSTAPDSRLTDVIVKKVDSSFSLGIKGPFHSASQCKIDGKEGEFYERFIPGQIIKAVFWNDRAFSVEIRDMPRVIGDGRSTIGELVANKPGRKGDKRRSLELVADTVAFYKKDI